MVTILDHFNRKIIRLNSWYARTIRKAQECYCKLIFLNKFSGPFDEYNNHHSSQQGAGNFDIEYAQIVCRVGCGDIKSVWKQTEPQMIIT